MINSNRNNIDSLKKIIYKEISPLIDNDFVLVDIPNHRNIGDSLIWSGELEFFKSLDFKCLKQFNRNTFRNNAVTSEKINILIHGGGNFGDIYESSQSFKRKIIEDFPNNKIIILPQTVHYNSKSNLIKDMELMKSHSNLHICVRDKFSYEILENYLGKLKLRLTPDMAFYLNFDKLIQKVKSENVLLLSRTDAEAQNKNYNAIIEVENYSVSDWPTYKTKNKKLNILNNYIEALDGKVSYIFKDFPIINSFIHDSYGFKNRNGMNNHIQKGIEFLSPYSTIYTTRLHGLILSILLDKKVCILDNSYGKNKSFYDCWLKDFNNLILI
ncbi:polysaccharide pyruvyl transferase family protein [Empedobacter brevis]|uniref:polysaccharide pyruvyl transferase family protein n=1 Tax=Empedobacter brevis TaxID=247 RepID=UPI0039AF9F93